jgi:AraC-like DNA-binding protein
MVRYGDTEKEYGPGSFLVVPPALLHSIYAISDEPLDRVVIHFDWVPGQERTGPPWGVPEQIVFDANKAHNAPDFVPAGILDGVIHEARTDMLLDWIVTDWQQYGHGIREPRGLLLTLLTALLAPDEKRAVKASEEQLAFEARTLLNDTACDDMSMTERLAPLRCSHEHITRVFGKHFGTTPTRYVALTRIEYARQLLRTTALPIAEIAAQCGFQSPAYFSRVFRANTGTSPSAFRRSTRDALTEWR